ncbi:dimethyladenosine transferase 2, mitochondrial isoform X3 [Ornithorhynchus anatinus]|uniref:rRNA adenine N(6)-methyltransferase n=1 Tax=Ornithorhynchus anatinus TaxID=9258 RepID=A0A6I8PDN8_ORNAN|nr:dimethyladenosine transferase 2, mitochondrial isoform X3 [Ornithorhynchus anatinus]
MWAAEARLLAGEALAGGVRGRGRAAAALRALSHSRPLPLAEEAPGAVGPPGRRALQRFPAAPELARTVARTLRLRPGAGPCVFECNPGPGILTRALLQTGARVVALESDAAFLPHLQSLKNSLDGQLEVVHCDFFALDCNSEILKPPAMLSEHLFEGLGIQEVPWTADIPVKIVGFLPSRREPHTLWRLLYSLYQRLSVFSYGRIELNMFLSEKEYTRLVSKPNEKKYQALSVLWQIACDIELLHMESPSNLCLVKMTPRKDLFSESLTPLNSTFFFHLVKQSFVKHKFKLMDNLNLWNPFDGENILKRLKRQEDDTFNSLFPHEFKYLFEAMEGSQSFSQMWLFENVEQLTSKS